MTSLPIREPDTAGVPDPASAGAGHRGVVERLRRADAVGPLLALVWLSVILVLALTAPILPIADPGSTSADVRLRPGFRLDEPLGTDHLGRSLLSRVLHGARVSLFVGLGASALAMVFGTALGVVSGYFRGRVEWVIDVLTTSAMAFPPLIFLIALASVLKPSTWSLTLSLAALGVPLYARVARANTLVIAEREFVVAARSMGAGRFRILAREILPNVQLPVLSYSLVAAAALIVAEGSLSFLGLGVRPPQPSWGGMIAAARPDMDTDPHLVVTPAAFFFLTVFSLNVIGDWARGRLGVIGD